MLQANPKRAWSEVTPRAPENGYALGMTSARRSWTLGLCMGALGLLLAPLAISQPAARFPTEQPAPIAARVALLEQRVHELERRQRIIERVGITPRAGGGYALVANGASVLIGPDGRVSVSPAPSPTVPDCDPPYSVDATGLRSIKPECLAVSECDPPYTVDANGIRRPKLGCK